MARKSDVTSDAGNNELCCCPKLARIWLETKTTATFVENKIDMKRILKARADASAAVQPPGGPGVDAEGAGGSELDEGTYKNQGKVYRVDEYIVHWKAEGCGPLRVAMRVTGAAGYAADWLPDEGHVTVSAAYMLEPPDYAASGPGDVLATLMVTDCSKQSVTCSNGARRP
ncbi:MAG TPA: hypothetical protein VMH86_17160 [Rhizomicrobium sp.]|nr:hypothetical protein [Rhizomicrobium sp.]